MDDPAADPRVAILLGADVGATRSRVRVRRPLTGAGTAGPDTLGELLGAAEGPGFNLNSSGSEGLSGLVETVRSALDDAGIAASHVRIHAMLGVAGAGPAHHERVLTLVRGALSGLGIDRADVHVDTDMVTAFAAGSASGDGLLLLAGTGAAAVRYERYEAVSRCDGMGWLLGDAGSAVWIGREVLQAAAADLDRRGPVTAITALVREHLNIAGRTGDPRQHLIAAAHALTPAGWGALAPIAESAGEDEVALAILERASAALLAAVDAVRYSDARTATSPEEIVMTGSVLSRNEVVSAAVRRGLAERGLVIRDDAEPVEGALRLAARQLGVQD